MAIVTRQQLLRKVSDRLRNRKLIWFGTRGEDAQCLLDLPQFEEVYSLIGALDSVSVGLDVCLERLTGTRVDLDTYDLDKDQSNPARQVRRRLFDSLGEPSVLLPYRPLAFHSAVQYPRSEYVEYLGLFHERQLPFEHKPWVETELRRLGIPVLPWRYYTDDNRTRVREQLEALGALVLRTNRTDGGVGVNIVRTQEELEQVWSLQPDGFLAASQLLTPHIPLNVSACVFEGGEVTLHPPSLQLLGIRGCTTRAFGYCGNDFSTINQLESPFLDKLQDITVRAGKWLHSKGYLGAYGVDALIHDNTLHLVEVNPRFQGSSALSALIDSENDRPDIFLSHIAAFLGVPPPRMFQLQDLANSTTSSIALQSQVVFHNCSACSIVRTDARKPETRGIEVGLLPPRDTQIEHQGCLFRAFIEGPVTGNGFVVFPEVLARLRREMDRFQTYCERPSRVIGGKAW